MKHFGDGLKKVRGKLQEKLQEIVDQQKALESGQPVPEHVGEKQESTSRTEEVPGGVPTTAASSHDHGEEQVDDVGNPEAQADSATTSAAQKAKAQQEVASNIAPADNGVEATGEAKNESVALETEKPREEKVNLKLSVGSGETIFEMNGKQVRKEPRERLFCAALIDRKCGGKITKFLTFADNPMEKFLRSFKHGFIDSVDFKEEILVIIASRIHGRVALRFLREKCGRINFPDFPPSTSDSFFAISSYGEGGDYTRSTTHCGDLSNKLEMEIPLVVTAAEHRCVQVTLAKGVSAKIGGLMFDKVGKCGIFIAIDPETGRVDDYIKITWVKPEDTRALKFAEGLKEGTIVVGAGCQRLLADYRFDRSVQKLFRVLGLDAMCWQVQDVMLPGFVAYKGYPHAFQKYYHGGPGTYSFTFVPKSSRPVLTLKAAEDPDSPSAEVIQVGAKKSRRGWVSTAMIKPCRGKMLRTSCDIHARMEKGKTEGEPHQACIVVCGRVIVGPARMCPLVLSRPGINIVAMDPATHRIITIASFDTENNSKAEVILSGVLEALPPETIVVVAAVATSIKALTMRGRAAMMGIGSQLVGTMELKDTFLLSGYAHSKVGAACEYSTMWSDENATDWDPRLGNPLISVTRWSLTINPTDLQRYLKRGGGGGGGGGGGKESTARSVSSAEKPGHFKIRAQGGFLHQADNCFIYVDDELIVGPAAFDPVHVARPGLNIALFNPKTGSLLTTKTIENDFLNALEDFWKEIPRSAVVAAAWLGNCPVIVDPSKFKFTREGENNDVCENLPKGGKKGSAKGWSFDRELIHSAGNTAVVGRKGKIWLDDIMYSSSMWNDVSVTYFQERLSQLPPCAEVYLRADACSGANNAPFTRITVNGQLAAGSQVFVPEELDELEAMTVKEDEEFEEEDEIFGHTASADDVKGDDEHEGDGHGGKHGDARAQGPGGSKIDTHNLSMACDEENLFTVVAVSADDGKVLEALNLKSSDSGQGKLRTFVENLSWGTLVCVACCGEALKIHADEALEVLKSLGGSLQDEVLMGMSYTLIGRVGARPGTAEEDVECDEFVGANGLVPAASSYHIFLPRDVDYVLTVQSAPQGSGDSDRKTSALITVDNMTVVGPSWYGSAIRRPSRGIHVVVIRDGGVRVQDCYKINEPGEVGMKEQFRLAQLIRSARKGEIIAFALSGLMSASSLQADLKKALNKLGLRKFKRLVENDPNEEEAYAAIVRVDDSTATKEVLRQSEEGKYAIVSYRWSPQKPDLSLIDTEKPRPNLAVSSILCPLKDMDEEDSSKIISKKCYRTHLSADTPFLVEITADEQTRMYINRRWYTLGPVRPVFIQSDLENEVNILWEVEEEALHVPELRFKHYNAECEPTAISMVGAAGTEKFLKQVDGADLKVGMDPLTGKMLYEEGASKAKPAVVAKVLRTFASLSGADKNTEQDGQSDLRKAQPTNDITVTDSFSVEFDNVNEEAVFKELDQDALLHYSANDEAVVNEEVVVSDHIAVKNEAAVKKDTRARSVRGIQKEMRLNEKNVNRVATEMKGISKTAKVKISFFTALIDKVRHSAHMVIEFVEGQVKKAYRWVMDKVVGTVVKQFWNVLSEVLDWAGWGMGTILGFILNELGGLIGMGVQDIKDTRDLICSSITSGYPTVSVTCDALMMDVHKQASEGVDKLADILGVERRDGSASKLDEDKTLSTRLDRVYRNKKSGQTTNVEANKEWLYEKLKSGLEQGFSWDLPVLTHSEAALKKFFKNCRDNIYEMIKALGNSFLELIKSLWDAKNTSMEKLFDLVKPTLQQFFEVFGDAEANILGPEGLFRSMVKDLNSMFDFLGKFRPEIPFFSSFARALFQTNVNPTLLEVFTIQPAVIWTIVEETIGISEDEEMKGKVAHSEKVQEPDDGVRVIIPGEVQKAKVQEPDDGVRVIIPENVQTTKAQEPDDGVRVIIPGEVQTAQTTAPVVKKRSMSDALRIVLLSVFKAFKVFSRTLYALGEELPSSENFLIIAFFLDGMAFSVTMQKHIGPYLRDVGDKNPFLDTMTKAWKDNPKIFKPLILLLAQWVTSGLTIVFIKCRDSDDVASEMFKNRFSVVTTGVGMILQCIIFGMYEVYQELSSNAVMFSSVLLSLCIIAQELLAETKHKELTVPIRAFGEIQNAVATGVVMGIILKQDLKKPEAITHKQDGLLDPVSDHNPDSSEALKAEEEKKPHTEEGNGIDVETQKPSTGSDLKREDEASPSVPVPSKIMAEDSVPIRHEMGGVSGPQDDANDEGKGDTVSHQYGGEEHENTLAEDVVAQQHHEEGEEHEDNTAEGEDEYNQQQAFEDSPQYGDEREENLTTQDDVAQQKHDENDQNDDVHGDMNAEGEDEDNQQQAFEDSPQYGDEREENLTTQDDVAQQKHDENDQNDDVHGDMNAEGEDEDNQQQAFEDSPQYGDEREENLTTQDDVAQQKHDEVHGDIKAEGEDEYNQQQAVEESLQYGDEGEENLTPEADVAEQEYHEVDQHNDEKKAEAEDSQQNGQHGDEQFEDEEVSKEGESLEDNRNGSAGISTKDTADEYESEDSNTDEDHEHERNEEMFEDESEDEDEEYTVVSDEEYSEEDNPSSNEHEAQFEDDSAAQAEFDEQNYQSDEYNDNQNDL